MSYLPGPFPLRSKLTEPVSPVKFTLKSMSRSWLPSKRLINSGHRPFLAGQKLLYMASRPCANAYTASITKGTLSSMRMSISLRERERQALSLMRQLNCVSQNSSNHGFTRKLWLVGFKEVKYCLNEVKFASVKLIVIAPSAYFSRPSMVFFRVPQ